MIPYYDDGQIQIYHADCRDVLPMIEPGSVDLVLTDPPYGVGYDLGNMTDHPDNRPYVAALLDAAPGATILAFGSYERYDLPGWDWRWTLIWHKPMCRARPTWGIARHYERIHWYTKGSHFLRPAKTMSDVLVYNPPIFRTNPENVNHPTQKPVGLVQHLLDGFAGEGYVLDPFMGSGTTLVAAKALGRRAIGIEIEERYCEIAVRRLQQSVLPLAVA